MPQFHRFHKRSILAAVRIAAIYAIGVSLLFLAMELGFEGTREVLQNLQFLAIPMAFCFGAAFLLLAVGRRLGFTALWLAVFGLWAWSISSFRPFVAPGSSFVLWSLLAAPLYLIVRTGFASTVDQPAWRRAAVVGWVVWAGLAVAAPYAANVWPADVGQLLPVRRLLRLLTALWYMAPVAVTAISLNHLHRRPRSADDGAGETTASFLHHPPT